MGLILIPLLKDKSRLLVSIPLLDPSLVTFSLLPDVGLLPIRALEKAIPRPEFRRGQVRMLAFSLGCSLYRLRRPSGCRPYGHRQEGADEASTQRLLVGP